MSDELQNESAEPVETNEAAVIENPTGSELATETEKTESGNAQQTEVTEEEKAVKRQEAFNKQYGATKQAERERDALKAEMEQLKQAQYQPPPKVGEYPNEFDYDTTEEFNQAKTAFLNNVTANATHDAQIKLQNDQRLATQQAAQQKQAQELNDKAMSFMESAKVNGVSEEEVTQHAATVINQYGIRDDLRVALIGHPEGVLMFKHLAGNPQDLNVLNTMNPYEAGAYIENTLKAKAVALKPKTSNTPKPSADIEGNGAESGKHPALQGVVYT